MLRDCVVSEVNRGFLWRVPVAAVVGGLLLPLCMAACSADKPLAPLSEDIGLRPGEIVPPVEADGVEAVEATTETVEPLPSGPCLALNPDEINFGGKKYGEAAVTPLEIKSCGDEPLELYGISIGEDSSPDFEVDLSALSHEPAIDNPVVVPTEETVTIQVVFVPDMENPFDDDGNILLDEGTVVVQSNAPEGGALVPLSGAGVAVACPTAVIVCAEGDEVTPSTELHLHGDQSYAPNGAIQKWEWDVEQPADSESVFSPSAAFPNPTFEVDRLGKYTFSLTVYDEDDTPSCIPAAYQVMVAPTDGIRVELVWHTPGDPDETDEGPETGTDLNLHFVHPLAEGPDLDADGAPDGWFDMPFDCFWFNGNPNWGNYDLGIDDDPHLDRDDVDGAGPENITLSSPESVTYRVGVHYWDDWGYGPSAATVRVYIYAQLVLEVADVNMVKGDMWEVCTIKWTTYEPQIGLVTTGDGQYKITPNYQNPYFFNP